MHISTNTLAMRSAYYIDGSFLGPVSSLEELQNAFGLQLVFLRCKSETDSAKGPVLQLQLVLVLRMIFVRYFPQTDPAESDRNFAGSYSRWFAGSQ